MVDWAHGREAEHVTMAAAVKTTEVTSSPVAEKKKVHALDAGLKKVGG